MSKNKLAFIGAGAQADAVSRLIKKSRYNFIGYFDDKKIENHNGYPVLGKISQVKEYLDNKIVDYVFITIGDNNKRFEVFQEICESHYEALINIVAPTAIILDNNSLCGKGIFVAHNAFIGHGALIFDNTIVNTGSIIEHHSTIKAHCNVAPNATVNGYCIVGEGCYLGSSSTLIQLIELAPWITIGAGGVVIKSCNESGTYVGVPIRKI